MTFRKSLQHISFLLLLSFSIFSCKQNNDEKQIDKGWFWETEVENSASSEEIEIALQEDNIQQFLFDNKTLQNFYEKTNFKAAWEDSELREDLMDQLKKADAEGLSFSDYHGKKLDSLSRSYASLEGTVRGNYEILLTDAFLKYAHDLYYGKLDPKQLYKVWGLKRKSKNFGKILQKSLQNQDIEAALSALKPNYEVYKGLKESLQEYEKYKDEESSFKKLKLSKILKPGEENPQVPQIVERLQQLDFLDKSYKPIGNIYDKDLEAAVRLFQKENALEVDGVLGSSSLKQFNKDNKQRYQQLLVNLERWRWYPRDLGKNYVMVNIASFELAVVKDGDTIHTHNIIAGSKSKQTPIFQDSIQYIVINPEWHIPASIKFSEVIPLAAKDPSYMSSRNMYATNSSGELVDPSAIDWSGKEVRTYNFTQKAGKTNSLGSVKIIYPNQYSIYLHDTPAKGLFDRTNRAESHGCVRVENAVELASFLVNNQKDWSIEKIEETIASGKTKTVNVTQAFRVYHLYWTAWREDGETFFTSDVYDLDQAVFQALQQKS